MNQAILTDNLCDPDLIRDFLAMPADKQVNMATNLWFVYILRCADNSLYTGITTDVNKRLDQHNGVDKYGAKYTHGRRPVTLVYQESLNSRSSASKREFVIKSLKKPEKERLISLQQ